MPEQNAAADTLSASGIEKSYGVTRAVHNVDLSIAAGEIVGLVGANGAGKSTLMRVLSGVTRPDAGSLRIHGRDIELAGYSPTRASELGIRVVYQELSLCTNLTVYENFYIEQSRQFRGLFNNWRGAARAVARASLDEVFPGNTINVNALLASLPIALQQMVEIARAASDRNLKILILDEPTSSLGVEETRQLAAYARRKRGEGVSFVYISHRLAEVITLADRIMVLQNAQCKWMGLVADTNHEDLVRKMGESALKGNEGARGAASSGSRAPNVVASAASLRISALDTGTLHGIELDLRGGQIIGIGGLEGSGQRELLRTIFHPGRGLRHAVRRTGHIAYCTGDRKKEGIFPLWSIGKNSIMARLAQGSLFRFIRREEGKGLIEEWYRRLKIVSSGPDTVITSLSGGNQQKVIIARAMIADADIVVLDDPTRGVDIQTKLQLYELFREAADKGKLIIWYSTEDEEFEFCDTVYILRYGTVVRELSGDEIRKDSVVNAYFSGEERQREGPERKSIGRPAFDVAGIGIPLGAMVLVFLVSGIMTPAVFSTFGITLLVGGAIPLIFATLAQMFVIGLSMIDLGIGAFMGFANVIGATVLEKNPTLGVLFYAASIVAYAGMGVLIHVRQIPALIVTLGASFIWTGIGYSILSMPGGKAPDWLIAFYNLDFPVVPFVLVIVAVAASAAFLIHRSRYGTVLRGFGNNAAAVERSGWSVIRAYMTGYALAGAFGLCGGIFVTAVTTGADANATLSYTLLTVAAVIMGGGELTGGVVSPLGAVFGAITLSLIGSLLGFLNVSSNFVAAVQGGILLAILALRLLGRRKRG